MPGGVESTGHATSGVSSRRGGRHHDPCEEAVRPVGPDAGAPKAGEEREETMVLDPTKMADWQIAEEAEKTMKTCHQLGEELGLKKEELLPHGHYIAKVDFARVLDRLKDKPDAKYIDVTAITPTPLGEGKSASSVGLIEGLGKRGKRVIRDPAVRRPDMNVRQRRRQHLRHPVTQFSLRLTGDTNDHELAQPGHGRPDLAHAARYNLSDKFLAGRPQAAKHRRPRVRADLGLP